NPSFPASGILRLSLPKFGYSFTNVFDIALRTHEFKTVQPRHAAFPGNHISGAAVRLTKVAITRSNNAAKQRPVVLEIGRASCRGKGVDRGVRAAQERR